MRRLMVIALAVGVISLYGACAMAQEGEYMTESGEIRDVSDGEVMTDSGEMEEVGDDGGYMTDSGEIEETSDDL